MPPKTHRITPFEQLAFDERPGRASVHVICADGYRARLLQYPVETEVREHAHHGGTVFKVVLQGSVTYDGVQTLTPGHLAAVEEGTRYTATVGEGTLMLLIEPSDSADDLGGER